MKFNARDRVRAEPEQLQRANQIKESQMNTGKNKFLLTTAVLLAGVSLASAQGMREGAGGSAAEHGRSDGATSQGAAGASRSEGMTQGRAGGRAEGSSAAHDSGRAADKSDKQTIGQGRDGARQSQSEQSKQGKDQTVGQSRGDRDQARQSKSESDKSGKQTIGQSRSDRDRTQSQSTEQNKSTTTGANARDKNAQDKNAQSKNAQGQSTTTTGANTKGTAQDRNAQDRNAQDRNAQGTNAQSPSTTTTGANTGGSAQGNVQNQGAQQGQGTTTGTNAQGQANAQAQTQGATTQSMSGRVQVNAQQQTQLQQSVLSSRNVDRVRVNTNAINFRINAGVVVPRNISVVSVAAYPALIDVYPDYRDDSFFVVDDEIIVTDRGRRIVDVIPAGPRTHYARSGGLSGGGGSIAALDLSPDEIRVVQRVLIERHMLSGEADGVLGPGTRRALMTFQRQEGFQASGSIDTRTVAALGVSNQIRATQGQSTTVGPGRQQPVGAAEHDRAKHRPGQRAGAAEPDHRSGSAKPAVHNRPGSAEPTGHLGSGQHATAVGPDHRPGSAKPAAHNRPGSAEPTGHLGSGQHATAVGPDHRPGSGTKQHFVHQSAQHQPEHADWTDQSEQCAAAFDVESANPEVERLTTCFRAPPPGGALSLRPAALKTMTNSRQNAVMSKRNGRYSDDDASFGPVSRACDQKDTPGVRRRILSQI
ncbi:hypothetical protein ACVMBY_006070 [Bradyrhizobium huanghuaihaiense]